MRAKKMLTSCQIFRYAVPARTVTKKHCLYRPHSHTHGSPYPQQTCQAEATAPAWSQRAQSLRPTAFVRTRIATSSDTKETTSSYSNRSEGPHRRGVTHPLRAVGWVPAAGAKTADASVAHACRVHARCEVLILVGWSEPTPAVIRGPLGRVHGVLEKSLKMLEFGIKTSRPLKVLENR